MQKLTTLIAIVIMTFAIAAPVFATDYGQLAVVVKSPKYNVGHEFALEAKGCLFMMTNFSQNWVYVGANRGTFTLYGGYVSNWSDEACGFGSLKFAPVFNERWTGLTDFHVIDNDGETDVYNWATIEYNTTLDEKPVYFGPHLETIRTFGETNHWVGIHVGSPDLVELGFYYHDEADYALRAAFVVQL